MNNTIKKMSGLQLAGVLLLAIIFIIPALSFAGNKKDIYVNASGSSSNQDGSSAHPYRKIGDALKKAEKSDKKVEVHVSNGVYKENIVVPSDTKIFGEDKKKTIIDADDKEAAVKLNHKAEINKLTITGGEYGVVINDGDRASVIECLIKNNDKDGIKIKSASTDDNHMAVVTESEIYDNGRSGIYSEKRKLSFIDNFIYDNDGDGIDIAGGSQAWIEGNKVKKNDKSGMKLTLDGSNIWTKNNTYYENKREGLEINTYGKSGRIDVNKSKFYKNDKYGIAKVNRNNAKISVWSGLTIQTNVIFWDNAQGNILEK